MNLLQVWGIGWMQRQAIMSYTTSSRAAHPAEAAAASHVFQQRSHGPHARTGARAVSASRPCAGSRVPEPPRGNNTLATARARPSNERPCTRHYQCNTACRPALPNRERLAGRVHLFVLRRLQLDSCMDSPATAFLPVIFRTHLPQLCCTEAVAHTAQADCSCMGRFTVREQQPPSHGRATGVHGQVQGRCTPDPG